MHRQEFIGEMAGTFLLVLFGCRKSRGRSHTRKHSNGDSLLLQ